jgi:hypothetical protein
LNKEDGGGEAEEEEKTTYELVTQINDFKLSFKLTRCEGMNRIHMAHNNVQTT